MARIRSIKPEFWTDPDVVAMPMETRLFFIGCWNHADDFGVLRDDPERLRLQIMPADQVNAVAIIDELVERRHLLRMTAPDGTKVLVVRTFCVHQKIDKRAVGRWGHPDDFTPASPAGSPPPPTNPAQNPPKPTKTHPGGGGTGGEGTGGEQHSRASTGSQALVIVPDASPPSATGATMDDRFEAFWSLYPNKSRSGKLATRKAWDKARKRADPDLIHASLVEHLSPASEWAITTDFVPGAARWLNEGRYLSPPPKPRRPSGRDRPADNLAKIEASLARMNAGQR
jgi:hypothetical protein